MAHSPINGTAVEFIHVAHACGHTEKHLVQIAHEDAQRGEHERKPCSSCSGESFYRHPNRTAWRVTK